MQLPANTNPWPYSKANKSEGSLQSKPSFFKIIQEELDQVRMLIDEQLRESSEPVNRLLCTFNICSGKMLRPGLLLLSGRCFGTITDKHIRIAAIVELVHNATLLHDDVIDEGQKRRGLPTVNSLRGNESAVLLGDYLLGQVFKMSIALEPEITDIIAATTMRICEGELRQITQRQNWQLSESEYIDIITEKTAALFSSSCLLGALLAGANEKQSKLLADFGLNLGIAFQITDDLLDIIGEEKKIGKTLGSDAGKNKLTMAVIHLLTKVNDEERSKVKGKLSVAATSKSKRTGMTDMLRYYGSLEYTINRAQGYIKKAIDSLTGLKNSDTKDALIETAKFVTSRAT